MLHGLIEQKNQNFNTIFTSTFSSILSDLLRNKIIRIKDYLGSTVFVIKSQNYLENKNINSINSKKNFACNNCQNSKLKREQCILIRSTFIKTKNITLTARQLGISRTTIYKHLK